MMYYEQPCLSDRRLQSFEMWIWRRMEKISWLVQVTNKEVIVNEDRQILNSIWQRKHRWMAMFRYKTAICMKLLTAE